MSEKKLNCFSYIYIAGINFILYSTKTFYNETLQIHESSLIWCFLQLQPLKIYETVTFLNWIEFIIVVITGWQVKIKDENSSLNFIIILTFNFFF